MTSPPTNQKNVHELITHPLQTLFLILSLKIFPCKPSGSLGFLSTSYLDFLFGACNKHSTFLHNLVSADWLYCAPVSRPKFGLVACLGLQMAWRG